jgi:hypothetical protein
MIKSHIRTVPERLLATAKSSPAESLLCLAFFVYGLWAIAVGSHERHLGVAERMWLFPLAFTLSYVLNRRLTSGRWRAAYYLSALAALPFFWVEMQGWPGTASFLTALGLCPAAVLLCRWRRDNARFVADAVRYARNGLFAAGMAGVAHLAVVAIYYSLRYVFPGLPLGDEERAMEYVALFFWVGAMPLVFLSLDGKRDDGYRPVRIVDATINWVITPALMLYTAILYAYFVKIAATWSLPDGGVAYMVFAFAMVAVAVKAYGPLMERRFGGWFYDRFGVISLPALAMFWTGVARRIEEYGLTEGRVYLLVCGGVMTLTVAMFLAARPVAYRWPVALGAALFALFAFVPGMTATDLAVASQQGRFDAVAARLGMLDGAGRLIVEKRPSASPARQADYATLWDAFEYVGHRADSAAMTARFGVADGHTLSDRVMPDNMPYGEWLPEGNTVTLRLEGLDVDVRPYAGMHKLVAEGSHEGPAYTYRVDSARMTILSPNGRPLLSAPLGLILERQLALAGLSHAATESELRTGFGRMAIWEDDGRAVVFGAMRIRLDGELTLIGVEPSELLVR